MSAPSRDRLAESAVRVVLHRLANASQHMASIAALARAGGGATMLEKHAEGLAGTARDVDESGLAFSLVATALGIEVAPMRNDSRAGAIAIEVARGAARRAGRDLAPSPEEVDALCEARSAWCAARLLYEIALQGSGSEPLRFTVERTDRGSRVHAFGPLPAQWSEGPLLDGRARLDATSEGCALTFAG